MLPPPKQKKQLHYNIAEVTTIHTCIHNDNTLKNKQQTSLDQNFSFSLEYNTSRHLFIKNPFTDGK